MPRTARADVGGYCYHVINRGNGRSEVFHKEEDYAAFARLLRAGCARAATRLLAYCLMPNHFQLILWPRQDDELGTWMQWLLRAVGKNGDRHRILPSQSPFFPTALTTHVRRDHKHYHSSGHVWQGRFKAFRGEGVGATGSISPPHPALSPRSTGGRGDVVAALPR